MTSAEAPKPERRRQESRRPYVSPSLRALGRLTDLTRGQNNGPTDFDGNQSYPET